YDPIQRNWSVIKQGPLPALNSFDHDDAHLLIASAKGVHVVQKKEGENNFHYFEKMSETDVSKVSLFKGGFLYLAHRNDSTGSDAGWMNFEDRRLSLVTGHDTRIQAQPKITDVVLVDNQFWIGTLGHGVLRYDIHNRRVTQANGTKAGTLITNVLKVGCFGNDLLLLADEHIYRWDKENQHWVPYLEGIADFRVDPSGQRLWRRTTGGEIITFQTGQPRFFSSQGITFKVGDEIVVVGYYQDSQFMAGDITQKATGLRVLLRDPNGRPLWAGPGNGNGNGNGSQGSGGAGLHQ
ncbi:MAG: hypothetical protein ACK2TZ_03365, partial [Anaerolineales bacterium]